MRKNRVRLTESQLHRVIKESVEQVLTEMKWKTMHDAYRQAYDTGREEQGERIGKLYRDMYDQDEKWSPSIRNMLGRGSSYDNERHLHRDDETGDYLEVNSPFHGNDLWNDEDEIRGHQNRYTGESHPANRLNKMGQKRLDWKQGKIPSSKMRQDI